jgi:Mg2+ and Co2+ transporter CorA
VALEQLPGSKGIIWFELACSPEGAEATRQVLGDHCPGLDDEMLRDLLTPDEEPEGLSYAKEQVKLASSFSVTARRIEESRGRGAPEGVGTLVFEPMELLASSNWLITCRHPSRVYRGPDKLREEPAHDDSALFAAVRDCRIRGRGGNAGDLGVSVMYELSLSYAKAHRTLYRWLEDWELSLYVDDDLDNGDQLPELWGLMAMLRNWLNPINKAGLRADIGKAWLPATNLDAVVEVDDRVDKALSSLARLSETLRQSFGLLHLEQTEKQRQQSEHRQHLIEAAAAVFLVPTLVVGFYGANTWVPGQGEHSGFLGMVIALVVLTSLSLVAVLYLQRRSATAARKAAVERERLRSDLLRAS